MIITFEIKADTHDDATSKAHKIGNMINLPFEVVGMLNDDFVQLTIEIQPGMINGGFVDIPFNVCLDE